MVKLTVKWDDYLNILKEDQKNLDRDFNPYRYHDHLLSPLDYVLNVQSTWKVKIYTFITEPYFFVFK